MHHRFFVAALFALTGVSSMALAQVPPDIAEGIRKVGPIVDGPGNQKLYAPLFANQKEPYPDVTVVSDIADDCHSRVGILRISEQVGIERQVPGPGEHSADLSHRL